MALKGFLRDFSITQLLNLINLARKTGTLIISNDREIARIFFREGKLSYGQFAEEDNSLAAILLQSSKITKTQYRILKERAGKMSDKELGLLLINAGYISQEDILGSIQQYSISIVRRLYTWVDGSFRFEQDEMPGEGKIYVRVDLENLIIEGSRQLREWEQLQEEIPSLEMALKFSDRPGTNLRNINLSVEEWRVVSYVNPKNSMQQIARATKMNDLEIRRIVYALLQAGLVEIVRPGGIPPNVAVASALAGSLTPSSRPAPVQNKTEQKGLVTRLINRIRSL
jgi:hypothetical protein